MIADFVTQVWDRYRALKEQRALAGLFHMIAFSDARGAALETQIATSVLCIESIKSYFALSEGSRYGIIEAPNGTFKWVGGGNVNFQDLLEQTLDDVGMPLPASFARIKKLRDAIVHRGFIRETDAITKHIFGAVPPGAMYRTMFETMEDMQDLLREFVLRLLAYKGPYELYKDAGHVSKTLP